MRFLSSRWFKVAVSLGLFTFLFYTTDVHALKQQLVTARPLPLLFAFVGYLISQALYAYKWKVLARPLGFGQPWRAFVTYYFVGGYFNLFAPSTVVGDLGRGLLLAANGGNTGPALYSVAVDRLSGLVMLVWVGATGFLLFGPTILPVTLCYGVVAAAIGSLLAWWLLPYVLQFSLFNRPLIRRIVDQLIAPYQQNAKTLGYACILSYLFHWFQLILQVVLAYALNLQVPLWYLMLFIPLVHILSALPLSFAGLGVREGGYVTFLALIGVGKDQALAFGLLWSVLVLGCGLVGGLVLLFSSEARVVLTKEAE
ncbi:MAG: flippase-like domain-containing protein [Deltaproteobacteria bacterium]|nr:flippase-like domain-containing protein [Deltaproteobacteria bacterium]